MKLIRVSNEFFGIHHWPQAPDSVWHLRNLHGHIFKVSAEMYVDHGNRDVEFYTAKFNLRDACILMVREHLGKNPAMSCEDMAEQIARNLVKYNNYNICEVVVSEPEIGDGIYRTINAR